MHRLLKYVAVIYDANCVIYQYFKSEIEDKGIIFIFDSPPFTNQIRKITQILRERRKNIFVPKAIFDEITQSLLATVIEKRLLEMPHQLRKMGRPYNSNSYFSLRQTLLKKIHQKIRKLQYEEWFKIDNQFQPDTEKMGNLIKLYLRMARDPHKQAKFHPQKSKVPSRKDLSLALFSFEKQLPLISNDSHMSKFSRELKDNEFCHEIYALMDIQI